MAEVSQRFETFGLPRMASHRATGVASIAQTSARVRFAGGAEAACLPPGLRMDGSNTALIMTPATLSANASHQGVFEIRVHPDKLHQLRLHMIGIGGTGMSGLAAMLLQRGATVRGSDQNDSTAIRRLVERGAEIQVTHAGAQIADDASAVVASAAIPQDHPELIEARRRGLPVLKYAELLGLIMRCYDGIAVSGTHGKSTTTAWLSFVLRRARLDPSFIVGATVAQLGGGSGAGTGRHFVAEACEYDRSFLNLRPRYAVVLNIEEDHLDCYKDLGEIRDAFAAFVGSVPADGLVLLNADDPVCRSVSGELAAPVATFGRGESATWRATDITLVDGCYEITIQRAGEPFGRTRLGLPGEHNIGNALAVAALAHACGASTNDILAGLTEFSGARRRLELRSDVGGIRILDDYAHHPTEIRATLAAARERYAPRRLWCVFQPHQHSRTRFLLEDFAGSFADADRVIVPDIYFVRDSQRDREAVCADDLVNRIRQRGGDATYLPAFGDIVELLAREARPDDVVITMGAGTIWKVADELVQRLGGHLPA